LEERKYDTTDSGGEPRRQYGEGGAYIDEHLFFDRIRMITTRVGAQAAVLGISIVSRQTGTWWP